MSRKKHNTEKYLQLLKEYNDLEPDEEFKTEEDWKRLEELEEQMQDLIDEGVNSSIISRCLELGLI